MTRGNTKMASKIRMTRGALHRCKVGDIDLLRLMKILLVDAKRTTAKLWSGLTRVAREPDYIAHNRTG